jgi:hypothetical protein
MQQRRWNVESFADSIPHLNLEQQLFHGKLLLIFDHISEPSTNVNMIPPKHPNIQHITCDPLCWEIEYKSKNKDMSKKMLRELINSSFYALALVPYTLD